MRRGSRLLHPLHDGRHLCLGQIALHRRSRARRRKLRLVRVQPRMATTAEQLAGIPPTLAERIASRSDVAADEAIADIVEVRAPLWAREVEMTRGEEQGADAEVDRHIQWQRAAGRTTLDDAAEPRACGVSTVSTCASRYPRRQK